MKKRHQLRYSPLILSLAILLAVSLACASTDPTATPVAPAQPAAPAAPTAAPQPTATLVPGAPAPTVAAPTPTRVLPTATAVTASNQPVYGGTMRMAANLDNKTMDPHIDGETYGRPVTYAVFNTIVGFDANLNIIPELAQSWEVSSDGKAVTFRLVPGVKFHDGTPVDAAAVKWSLDRIMNPETGSPHRANLNPVSSIAVVDATTFVINLKAPYRPLMAVLGDRPGFVVPKTAPIPGGVYGQISGTAGTFAVTPVGSGAFKVKDWRPASNITLVKSETYWQKGKPYLDSIVLQFVPETGSQLAMLRTGETDLIEVQSTDLGLVRSNPNIKIVLHESGRWVGIGPLSVDVPPWNNKALRQALAYGIDRQAYVNLSLQGNGRPAYTSEGGIGWTTDPNLKPIVSDKAIAKQKLAEAGFPNGTTVPAYCDSTAFGTKECEIFQSMLADVGLKLNIIPTLTIDYTPKQTKREITSRFVTSWRPRADPDGRLRILFYSTGGQAPLSGYNNPEVDKLLDQAATIFDTAKAKQIYNQAETMIIQDVPFVVIAYSNNYAGLNAKVQNFSWIPDFQFRLRDLWIAR